MELIKNLSNIHIESRAAITLGKFDGLHLGHQKLLSYVLKKKPDGMLPALFTFDAPPNQLLLKSNSKTLLTNKERYRLAASFGMELMVQCPFTPKIAKMEPEDFIKRILIDKLNVSYIVIGADFHFGHNRKGDVSLLKQLSEKYSYELEVLEKEQYKERVISSTYTREALEKGDLDLVKELLGYPYFITGEILHGKQLGRTWNVPTINQIPDEEKFLPPNGVYASRVYLKGKEYLGMTNIGVRPTVEQTTQRNVETYLFDFQGDVYGETCMVELHTFIRSEKKFISMEELREQIWKDMSEIRRRCYCSQVNR